MKIVGIDYSNNNPGVCLFDGETFSFLSVMNQNNVSKARIEFISSSIEKYPSIKIKFVQSEKVKGSDYCLIEREKSKRLDNVTWIIGRIVSEFLSGGGIVSLEGLAFGARGNSFVDLALGQGMMRSKLISGCLSGDAERLFVYATGEIKNAIGAKGNADKRVLLDAFLEDPLIPGAEECDLRKYLTSNYDNDYVINKKGEVCHPWEDLVDAYLCVLKTWKAHQ